VVFSKSCPLFVPLAEEGWIDKEPTALIIEEYLSDLIHSGIDTLVLGCTHYPILRESIQSVVGAGVKLIDSALSTATFLRELLEKQGIRRRNKKGAEPLFFLSDIPRKFPEIAERFLGRPVTRLSVVDMTHSS
jgi:glutamate racemase